MKRARERERNPLNERVEMRFGALCAPENWYDFVHVCTWEKRTESNNMKLRNSFHGVIRHLIDVTYRENINSIADQIE